MKTNLFGAAALLVILPISGMTDVVSIEPYPQDHFHVKQHDGFVIPVRVSTPGTVQVMIYSPDGDRVITLEEQQASVSETLQFTWDGKDDSGVLVPDEAWLPKILWQGKGEEYLYDPAVHSGGEAIDSIVPEFGERGSLSFTLDYPSRLLVRAGLKAGPLMRTLVNWEPRNAGSNRVAWNGYDRDNQMNLLTDQRLGVLVTGYRLPEHSIITVGGESDYLQWREQKGWQTVMPDMSAIPLVRNGQRLSRQYFLPRQIEAEPNIEMSLSGDSLVALSENRYTVQDRAIVRVNMDSQSEWAMAQSQYEIGFFINGEFVAEEEQGYVPLSWQLNAEQLEQGENSLTVNVSGFNGVVGVRTIILIKE